MKILYFFKQYNTPMYLWQSLHIVNELSYHNIEVDVLNILLYESSEQANDALIKRIKNGKYDLFMTPHDEEDIFIDSLKEIKKNGIPTLLICFDNLVVPFQHKNICKYFDLVWLTSNETRYLFEKWGANTLFLPYAANPYAFKFNKEKEINRVVFLGTPYGSRTNMINCLTQGGINTTLFGTVSNNKRPNEKNTSIRLADCQERLHIIWEYSKLPLNRKIMEAALIQKLSRNSFIDTRNPNLEIKKSVSVEAVSKIYSQYSLALSSSSARNTGILKKPVDIVNLRNFEIPMSGGIQFCRYTKELAEYFESEKEIIFYSSNDEMLEQAQKYLSEKACRQRTEIRIASRFRAEHEHTWYCRFSVIFKRLGIGK